MFVRCNASNCQRRCDTHRYKAICGLHGNDEMYTKRSPKSSIQSSLFEGGVCTKTTSRGKHISRGSWSSATHTTKHHVFVFNMFVCDFCPCYFANRSGQVTRANLIEHRIRIIRVGELQRHAYMACSSAC